MKLEKLKEQEVKKNVFDTVSEFIKMSAELNLTNEEANKMAFLLSEFSKNTFQSASSFNCLIDFMESIRR